MVTSRSTATRVSTRLGSPASPMHTTRPPGSTSSTARAGTSAAFVASTAASHGRSGSVSHVHTPPTPSDRANATERGDRPTRCTSAPRARGEHRREEADRAGPHHEEPPARLHRGAIDGTDGVAAGLHERAHRVVDRVRQRQERRGGDREPLGERPGPVEADPDLDERVAHVMAPGPAAPALAAPEHRVAGHPPAHPARIHARPGLDHDARPLVADPHRIRLAARVQVGHAAGVELDVGAAHAAALHVDHDLARRRHGHRNVLDARRPGAGDDERPHRASTTSAISPP